MNLPLVSVIIPVYNGANYLAEAIESALAQTYHPLEIIVVNDGSTDETAVVAGQFADKIRYFSQDNDGDGKARNKGVQLAESEFLAFLDCDDIWVKNKVEIQINFLSKNPEFDGLFGQVQQFYSPELDEITKKRIRCPDTPLPGHIPSSFLIKREAFFQVGLFNTDYSHGAWADWYVRAVELGLKIATISDIITYRRLYKTNQWENHRDYLLVLKASIDRRRRKDI